MTIHSGHPFMPAEPERSPVRRLRGRLPSPVTLWTAGGVTEIPRAGLTVSSVLIADGQPGQIVGIIDPLSDLWDALTATAKAVVSILDWRHRQLADQFGYVAPAPGGPFRSAQWQHTGWGPALADASAWAGCRLADGSPSRQSGWGMLVQLEIQQVHLAEDAAPPLVHRRGHYLPPGRNGLPPDLT